MLKKELLLVLGIGFIGFFNAQEIKKERKKSTTARVSEAPVIDGILNDTAWKDVALLSDFITFRPDNGKRVTAAYQTTVKVIYDDAAIYISATMLDPDAANIPQEFANRDNFSQADFFLVTINPNDDGQNPFEFIVQSTGNQADAKISNGNEDFNWSAVWKSAVAITPEGWQVEMEIPYRAIRFANSPVQSWGFNFHRRLENLNEQHTWAFIDNSIGRWTQHDGLIEGFENIKPPTRLNLYPYASATTTTFESNTDFDWSAGMDVKYGLTENFTLDATLIPDFSQVGFDDVVLNLGPFEQQFSEQRQFFTEGTELFNKGRLFYSRRIGAAPIDQFNVIGTLSPDEKLINSPGKVTMLNVIKVSGRTKKGLGIGFFNAITEKTEATIKNNTNGTIRKSVTNPFTNYNIMLLDQQFNQNSSIALINTNVTRDGRFRDANVTALTWHLETKDSKYNADGSFKLSNIYDDINYPNTGYTFDNSFGKNAGHWNWKVGYNFENKDFNPNDLGILFSNNQQSIYGNIGWRTLQPTKNFNSYRFGFYNQARFQHYSGSYTGNNAGLNFSAQTKARFSFGSNLNYGSENKDFFEPRQGTTSGIYFLRPQRLNVNGWISTNSQKLFQLNANGYHTTFSNNPKTGYGFSIAPRYRFNNQFSLRYQLNFNKTKNDQGYVDEVDNNIIFGIRDRKNYTNTISGKYSFSTNSSLSLSFRHYWGAVNYTNFYNLNTVGKLDPNTNYTSENVNFNNWNLDLNYIWQFAPGSQLIAFYRNSIFNNDTNANLPFFKNLKNLFDQSQKHTLSIRIVYFIDYNKIKKILDAAS
ncbi:carbohydrate binding family 9 domain-containing protein [Polaribacter sp.]|nr:carbohydrate binding family 9 domain-containing protein [Polaribacter sp.]